MLLALCLALSLFSSCWLLHVLIWRLWKPGSYLVWLPIVFFLCPMLVAPFYRFAISALDSHQLISAAALHFFLSCCYICGFAGVQEYSPSAEILKTIRKRMPAGIPQAELHIQAFNEYAITGKRIEHLCAAGLVKKQDDVLSATSRGKFLYACCRIYRRILGVGPRGEG